MLNLRLSRKHRSKYDLDQTKNKQNTFILAFISITQAPAAMYKLYSFFLATPKLTCICPLHCDAWCKRPGTVTQAILIEEIGIKI